VVYNGPANGDVTLDIDGPVQTGNVIPEPGTFPLLLTGLAGIVAGIKARRARRAA
jgi:hypothetical protein